MRISSLLGDQQKRRGPRGHLNTQHRIAGAADKPAPSECAIPDPMGSEVSLLSQFRRATFRGFGRLSTTLDTLGIFARSIADLGLLSAA